MTALPRVECGNARHDHVQHDVDGAEIPGLAVCNGCPLPVHYDEGPGAYLHDDLTAPECFLTVPPDGPLVTACAPSTDRTTP